MRPVTIAIVIVALTACALYILLPDGESDILQEAEPDAGFSVSVSYSSDRATLTLSPRCAGEHTWTVEHDGGDTTVTTSGGGVARVTVPISREAVVTHTVTDGDVTLSMSSPVRIDGEKAVTLQWSGGVCLVDLDWTTYHGFRDRGTISYSVGAIAQWDDPAARQIAEYLEAYCHGMGNDEKARTLLTFIQDAIDYETDMQSTGREEWFKSVYETVYDGVGDCEDTAIMFTSVGRLMGLDIMMVDFVGHLGAAVVMDDCSGTGWTYDGRTYWYCETAVDGSHPAIGEDPIGAEFIALVL